MNWLKDRLVPNWRSSWRWWSVRLHAIATAMLAFLQLSPAMPPELQALIPQPWGMVATAVWALLGLLARIWAQRPQGGCDHGQGA